MSVLLLVVCVGNVSGDVGDVSVIFGIVGVDGCLCHDVSVIVGVVDCLCRDVNVIGGVDGVGDVSVIVGVVGCLCR